ncbi:MAG: (Fe-S)-binding protein, partial [Streptomyces sp.]|nr:(Fe-S)-binding protein [Streptomyces sp.]
AATGLARRAAGAELIPGWLPEIPGAAPRALPRTAKDGAAAVYYPACVNRIFGPPDGRAEWLPQALVTVSARAGLPVWIPPDVAGTCCATIWHSKGYEAGNAVMANRIVEHAWMWTGGGRLPIVVDATSCTLGLAREVVPYLTEANRGLHGELTVLDSTVWAAERVLPRLRVTAPVGSAVVHPTCSGRHLGRPGAALAAVAAALAEEVVVPDDAGCCGFAGDRGMLHEELTAAATRAEAEEVAGRAFSAYLCASRMCEVGMARATGEPYESVIVALERATRGGQ